jgi:glycosyltransferase involved in cell wall biosynthesis
MDFSKNTQSIGSFSLLKLARLFRILGSIIRALIVYRPTHIYYPPAGNNKVPVFRDFVLLFPLRLLRYKLIFHYHAGGLSEVYAQLSPIWKPVFRFVYYKAAYSVCLSEHGKKDPLLLQSKHIVVIPTGVDDPHPRLPVVKPDDIFTVLFIGICRESKGVLDFIRVIEQCHQVNSKITGIIAGEILSDKEEIAITEAVKKGFISYVGIKTGEAKRELFTAAHCLLFPSFFEAENFPTVILEAFSFGLPVVATRWRGMPDQVTDGYTGFLHNLHDVNGMSASILQLANDSHLYDALSHNARKVFETNYTNEIFEQTIVEQFNAFV